jgi:hypothetical protein
MPGQTSHALDHVLNLAYGVEPSILRLGGRCHKESEEILKRAMSSWERSPSLLKAFQSQAVTFTHVLSIIGGIYEDLE